MTATTTQRATPSGAPQHRRSPSRRRPGGSLRRMRQATPLTYFALIMTFILSVFPLWWMFVVATRTTTAASQFPPALVPGANFFHNVGRLFENSSANFMTGLMNSLIASTSVAVSVVFFCSLAGFALAKLQFKGRAFFTVAVVVTMAVPVQIGLVPLLILMDWLGWRGELQSVIVPFMVSGFGVFMMRQYVLQTIPDDLMEAARIDGCSTFRIYWSVVLPALRPAMVVLGLLTFMQTWNEFIWALAVLSPENPTVQFSIQQLNESAFSRDFALMFTGATFATLPLLIIFFVFGRQLVGRIMEGAIKA
ncbi:carbohydrate ABC transporter permease [Streptomonospora litoralis]|uniref:L-arabinose transport system permease protein AraQ n=1 Tax=Streptomonospora litoralis TaxID=2498135 RepID=A0A4P6Q896_9ACTN|nr:carbohydrate ABC transporter permease [Streptomonospora litoralis]QBI55137.1 L-arabinose transport system permease protein AraQ [Streptomonospora litoralis]